MADSDTMIYSFAEFWLDVAERRLYRGQASLTLAPKMFDTLLLLVENAGHILSKERMLTEVWHGSFVEENNLAQNISHLRRLLGESAETKYIETVPKYGYRFLGDVTHKATTTEVFESSRARIFVSDGVNDELVLPLTYDSPALRSRPSPETHYVQNGDVNIAYQVVGDGPIDIVFVMGWVSHLEYFWKHHLFASFLERLASFSRLILFDKRGTGLSDRVPLNELPTLEQRMEDVYVVMDAVNSQQAVLVGVSEGGPMCSVFAATYPERTLGLVMIGTYAKRIRDADYPWAPTEKHREAFFDIMRRDWGGPVGIEERAPSMAADEEFRDWWATYLRMGASPGAAVALTKMNAEIDVRAVLPSIRVPTLVLHRRGDLCLKVEEGRFVAGQIAGSKYIELEGIDHLPFVGDQDAVLDEIEKFLTDVRFSSEIDRVLTTVLSVNLTDIATFRRDSDLVESTRLFIRRQLDAFKGREVAYGRGQFLATFAGPARAIRCAKTIVQAANHRGIDVKTGLHTGECEMRGDSYSGVAVEVAKSIVKECSPGEILVSRTVKDLVAGSGLEFAEFGIRSFDAMDGDLRLFTVIN